MRSDDRLDPFIKLPEKEPDLMQIALHVSVAALLNVQSTDACAAELKRRAVQSN